MRMKKRIYLITAMFIMLVLQRSYAQQDPHYTMFMFNALSYNPAYAGSQDQLSATLLGRKQWVSFPGSPFTGTLNVHTPLRDDRMGVGLSLISDRAGAFSQNSFAGAYSYALKFNKMRLSFGLQAMATNFSADLTGSRLSNTGQAPVDNAFAGNVSVFSINFGTGAFLNGENFFAGISAPHLLNSGMEKKQAADPTLARQDMHLYLMGGYLWQMNAILELKPSAMIKVVKGAPVQADMNLMLYGYKLGGIGLGYRSGDALSVLAEVKALPNLNFAYAFDFGMSRLARYNSGSHELILQYRFGFNKQRLTSPRLF
jgi:type IX secretion system PorP/SprF family membrane protein